MRDGVIDKRCPKCGELCLVSDRRGKITYCACDTDEECYEDFIRSKGLEEEYRKYKEKRKKELAKKYGKSNVETIAEKSDDIDEFLETVDECPLREYVNMDEEIEIAWKHFKKRRCSLQEFIEKMAEHYEVNKKEIEKIILASEL